MTVRTEKMNITEKKRSGRIISIQHFSLDDGPGIRTTVFLKGCGLNCVWCHNPEAIRANPELLYRSEKCVGCRLCESVCQTKAHRFENEGHTVDRKLCVSCGKCTEICPAGALELAGKTVSVEEVLQEVLTDSVFYRRSGGGVTVSGGEPLVQAGFVTELLKACRENGLHTCIETCGYGKKEDLLALREWTDLFLYDCKLTDEALHKKYTGVSNLPILENLDALCGTGARVFLRCPMIPDINLTKDHFDGIARLANRYKNIEEIHLEPYHPLGINKRMALGKPLEYERTEFLNAEELISSAEYIQQKVSAKVKIL